MSQPKRKITKQHRREVALRAAVCRSVAISRGYRHTTPLLDALARYAVVSDKLPYASQITLARDAGVTDRTIRRWLVVLEHLGVVTVYRSKPRLRDGIWTRSTNRYLLTDRRAGNRLTTAPTCAVRQRRGLTYRTPLSPKPYGYESGEAATGPAPPPPPDLRHASKNLVSSPAANQLVDAKLVPPESTSDRAHPAVVKKHLAAARAALTQQR